MQSGPRESLLVFSDVHLGSDLDDRHALAPKRSAAVDHDLIELVEHYRAQSPEADRWRIVIAGDFIDFIGMTIDAAGPLETSLTPEEQLHGLGNAADHAREKLARVALRHADVFAKLAAFVADGHALTLVHGNHDIEFHWDAVKEDFKHALLQHARASHPGVDEAAFAERIEFNPWFFWRDGVAFIEHGHQYDPFCATPLVMAPLSPLDPRRIAQGFCEVLIRFVVRPTRGMRESGHEHLGVFHYIAFGAQLGLRGIARLGIRFVEAIRELLVWRRAWVSETAANIRAEHERRIAQFSAAKRIGMDRLRALLTLQVAPVTSTVRGIMASLLLDRIAVTLATLLVIGVLIALGYGVRKEVLLGCLPVAVAWGLLQRHLTKSRSVDPAAQMAERATQLAKLFPAAFIVMGHTHVPQSIRAGASTYVNVGSWAEQEAEPDRAARTHLVIYVRETGAEARFCTWTGADPALIESFSPAATAESSNGEV